jgi:putative FmdB family regulatory protein
MPVYEYLCEDHGPFEALRPMAEFASPCACPDCGGESPRVLLTPPRVGASDRSAIKAHDVNARSADSPKKLSSHGPGCGCCSGGSKKSSGKLVRPDGSKSFPKKRPWMISH